MELVVILFWSKNVSYIHYYLDDDNHLKIYTPAWAHILCTGNFNFLRSQDSCSQVNVLERKDGEWRPEPEF
jgi:hypothetical protein